MEQFAKLHFKAGAGALILTDVLSELDFIQKIQSTQVEFSVSATRGKIYWRAVQMEII